MSNKHNHSDEVINRLAKIEGHIRGVIKMVESEKSCDAILLQISAIQAAITKVGQIVLTDHFDHCILEKILDVELKNQITDFKKSLSQFIK